MLLLKQQTDFVSYAAYCIGNYALRVILGTDQLSWYYIQSGVTDLLIMGDPHYGGMCFESVKTLGFLFLALTFSQLRKYII